MSPLRIVAASYSPSPQVASLGRGSLNNEERILTTESKNNTKQGKTISITKDGQGTVLGSGKQSARNWCNSLNDFPLRFLYAKEVYDELLIPREKSYKLSSF